MAQVLAERTRDTDLDKDQKLAEAKKDAERALVTVETDVPTAGYPPEQIEWVQELRAVGGILRVWGRCHSKPRIGPRLKQICESRLTRFRSSRMRSRYFGLAVALDMQNKNPEALKYVQPGRGSDQGSAGLRRLGKAARAGARIG